MLSNNLFIYDEKLMKFYHALDIVKVITLQFKLYINVMYSQQITRPVLQTMYVIQVLTC